MATVQETYKDIRKMAAGGKKIPDAPANERVYQRSLLSLLRHMKNIEKKGKDYRKSVAGEAAIANIVEGLSRVLAELQRTRKSQFVTRAENAQRCISRAQLSCPKSCPQSIIRSMMRSSSASRSLLTLRMTTTF